MTWNRTRGHTSVTCAPAPTSTPAPCSTTSSHTRQETSGRNLRLKSCFQTWTLENVWIVGCGHSLDFAFHIWTPLSGTKSDGFTKTVLGQTARESCTLLQVVYPQAECTALGHGLRDHGQLHCPSQTAHSLSTASPSPGQTPREPSHCSTKSANNVHLGSFHTCYFKYIFFLQFLQGLSIIYSSSLCLSLAPLHLLRHSVHTLSKFTNSAVFTLSEFTRVWWHCLCVSVCIYGCLGFRERRSQQSSVCVWCCYLSF